MKKLSGRLSTGVIPAHYQLEIEPHFEHLTFSGAVTISLVITKPTKKIILHVKQLEVSQEAYLVTGKKMQVAKDILIDAKQETCTFVFASQIPKGKHRLMLNFAGKLGDNLSGFYKSSFVHEGKEHLIATTQFEATDARAAFPCFDEPHLKAIFSIAVIAPEKLSVISNTLSVKKESLGGNRIKTFFAPTPKMSTYLVAFIIGNFEYIEGKSSRGVEIKVYTTPGKLTGAGFALKTAIRALDFLEDYFDIRYPLPTLDLIAIPDFAAGAMENWGAITYRESSLLFDEATSSVATKQRVATVIAHELAHQWFGNLVTMEWWTHLWLNEGFATYMETLVTNHLFPEWQMWESFIDEHHNTGLSLDELQNTHPIEVAVHHPDEINQIFDTISYRKGASVIRMLAEYIGEQDFQKGLRHYLKKHSHKNTTTEDLWEAFEKASKKPVTKLMKNWTATAGFPLVTATKKRASLVLKQQRFFADPRIHDHKQFWQVPLNILSEKNAQKVVLTQKPFIVRQVNSWVKINAGESSFVCVNYDPELLASLELPIKSRQLSRIDRLGILRDVRRLTGSGKVKSSTLLEVLSWYSNESDYIIWAELTDCLAGLHNLFFGQVYYESFRLWALNLISQIKKHIGFYPQKHESELLSLLRIRLVNICVLFRGKDFTSFAIKEVRYPEKIVPNMKNAIFNTYIQAKPDEAYKKFISWLEKAKSDEAERRIIRALGFAGSKEVLERALVFSQTPKMRNANEYIFIYTAFSNTAFREIVFEFVLKHWSYYSSNFGVYMLDSFIEPMEVLTDVKYIKKIDQFFRGENRKGVERTVEQVKERIAIQSLWLKRDKEDLINFFQ